MRTTKRLTVYAVSSREHGICYLSSLTAALHHVKECVRQDGSDNVTLKRQSITKATWDRLPDTCEYSK